MEINKSQSIIADIVNSSDKKSNITLSKIIDIQDKIHMNCYMNALSDKNKCISNLIQIAREVFSFSSLEKEIFIGSVNTNIGYTIKNNKDIENFSLIEFLALIQGEYTHSFVSQFCNNGKVYEGGLVRIFAIIVISIFKHK